MKSYKGILHNCKSGSDGLCWASNRHDKLLVAPGLAFNQFIMDFVGTRSRVLENSLMIESMYAVHKFLPFYPLFSLSFTTSVWPYGAPGLAAQLGNLEYLYFLDYRF